jgi:hypothetical protein
VGERGWGRGAYLSQAHLVAGDSEAEEAVAVEEEEDAESLPRVELVQRLTDSRNPRPEGDAKVPETGRVDNVEVFHLNTVFEVGDSATESATKQRRRGQYMACFSCCSSSSVSVQADSLMTTTDGSR